MQHDFRCRAANLASAGVALLLAGVLAGCTPPGAVDQADARAVDEVGAHGGDVCPKWLPRSRADDDGFGTSEPAESSPSLAPPQSAWVCRYGAVKMGPGPDGDGTTWGWQRARAPQQIDAVDLMTLERYLSDLSPARSGRLCTSDLGPRWMLVHEHNSDLTGVVVDDYGCQDIRLTDEPFDNPPGNASQPGTVSGVLQAPQGFLGYLKAASKSA